MTEPKTYRQETNKMSEEVKHTVGRDAFAPENFASAWNAFCDCDYHDIGVSYDDFVGFGESNGFFKLRAVEPDDLDDSFAYERGIEEGGSVWELTDKGRDLFRQYPALSKGDTP